MPRLAAVTAIVAALALITTASAQVPSPTPNIQTAAPSAVDRTIDLLLAKDADALANRVRFVARGCVAEGSIGSPPACAPGQPVGTPVPTFGIGSCEGTYLTSRDAARSYFAKVLGQFRALSLYAVVKSPPPSPDVFTYGDYVIAITAGEKPTPTAPVIVLGVTAGGELSYASTECGDTGAQRRLDFIGANAKYVYGPQNQCTPGESATVAFPVAGISGDMFTGDIFAPVDALYTTPPGERYIVHVTPDTRFDGTINYFSDLRDAMPLSVKGTREKDCVIDAAVVDTPDVPAPVLTITPDSGPCDATVTVAGINFPAPAAVTFKYVLPNSDQLGAEITDISPQDGTFSAQLDLGAGGCEIAATAAAHGRTSVTIAADQTHLPPDIYATVQYRYVLPAPVVAPNTGDGTSAAHAHRTPLALALGAMALACAALAGGFLLKRR